MNVVECDDKQKNEWNKFIAENNPECFLQTWQWGEFQKSAGKKVWRIAVIDEDKIMASVQIIKHNLSFLGSYLYCPRGPIIKIQNPKSKYQKILEILCRKIEEIARKEKGVFLKIEPAMEANQESGIKNEEYLKGFIKSNAEIQPKNTLMVDLKKSEEELLAEMKQKTRYNIRLSEKRGVKIKISSDCASGFPKFWSLIEETSKRNKIASHPRKYYLKMLETLKENGNITENKLFARMYLAEYNGKIIASSIVLFFSDFAVYLHGASSNEDKNVMAAYLLQWKQILDAKKIGCKKYDFWGIAADGEKENWKGITRFKRGFGGFEKKYVGSFDAAYDKAGYFQYGVIKRLKTSFCFNMSRRIKYHIA